MTVRGHVKSGRLVVDVPTDLPEGTEVELVTVGDVVEGHQVADDNKGRSVIDAAGDLVGTFEGPRDLSTSPRHMRGFGR
jgi:hypothetical protein